TERYINSIRSAKKRLWITSPAFSDKAVMEEIIAAAQRGVDVRIIGPGLSNAMPLTWINQTHAKALIDAGGRYYTVPEMMHMKALISDNTALLSSYNITRRSRQHLHEVGVVSKDAKFV